MYRDNEPRVPRDEEWNMDLTASIFSSQTTLQNLSILRVFLDTSERENREKAEPVVKNSVEESKRVLGSSGIKVRPPTPEPDLMILDENDLKLEGIFKAFEKSHIYFLMVITPKADDTLYDRIKWLGYVMYGLRTV